MIKIPEDMEETSYIHVSRYTKSNVSLGQVKMKLDTLIECLLRGTELQRVDDRIEYNPLPHRMLFEGCVSQQWLAYDHETGDYMERVLVDVPKQKWDVFFHHQPFIDVGFPRLLIRYDIQNHYVKSMYVFAIKEGNRNLDENAPLFYFPFPNVDGRGLVCFGTTKMPKVERFSDIKDLHKVFISNAFSGDWYFSSHIKNKKFETPLELFQALEGKDFDDQWLVATGNQVKSILKTGEMRNELI